MSDERFELRVLRFKRKPISLFFDFLSNCQVNVKAKQHQRMYNKLRKRIIQDKVSLADVSEWFENAFNLHNLHLPSCCLFKI